MMDKKYLFKCDHCDELVLIKEIYTCADITYYLDITFGIDDYEVFGIPEGYYCSNCDELITNSKETLLEMIKKQETM